MKRIVVCCDGTWNTADESDAGSPCPTNVAKLAQLVAPCAEDGTPQVTYYHEGVGTGNGLDKLVGGAFGAGLSENIAHAYRFLVNNYCADDELYLFGFSRGAYTARSLVGLIRNSGLLKKQHSGRFSVAYELYRDRSEGTQPKANLADTFRQQFSWQPEVKFVGVWDTVGSLGVPDSLISKWLGSKWTFHDVRLSGIVKHAFHAMAIDEKRADFQPCPWEVPSDGPADQECEQVWFAGVHCDVGGGYPEAGLSDVALQWMVDKAQGCDLAIAPDNLTLAPDPYGTLHDSRTGLFHLRPERVRTVTPPSIHQSANLRKKRPATGYDPDNWPKKPTFVS